MNLFEKIKVFIQDHYFLVGFMVLALSFGTFVLITSQKGQRQVIQTEVSHAVALNELKHQKDSVTRVLVTEQLNFSFLASKRVLRADSLAILSARVDSLQQAYDESYSSPNHDSALQLELFFAEYYRRHGSNPPPAGPLP